MKSLKLITLAIVATTASLANADVGSVKPASVSAEIGSLGYGAKIAWDVNDKTELQVGINGGDVVDFIPCDCAKEREVKGVTFNMDSSFSNPYVGVQIRPMNNAFTVGTGVMHIGNNKVNGVANPSENMTIPFGDEKYKIKVDGTAKAQIDAEIKFKNSLAPYLTAGVHPNQDKRFSVFGELGAVYTGGVKTDVQASGKFYNRAGDEVDFSQVDGANEEMADRIAKFKENARSEFDERVQDTLKGKDKFYPIVKVGVTTRF